MCGLTAVVGMDGCGHTYMDFAVFYCSNMIRSIIEYWYERSLREKEQEVFQVSDPRAGCAGPTHG